MNTIRNVPFHPVIRVALVAVLCLAGGSGLTLAVSPIMGGGGGGGEVPLTFNGGLTRATNTISASLFLLKTTAYTAVSGDKIVGDTTSAAFTITLPASPSVGDSVIIGDPQGTWATNNLTIGRNSQAINGSATNFTANVSSAKLYLVFVGGTTGWRVFVASYSSPVAGWTGGSNVTTDRSYDANATSIDELADVLGTLISDLKTSGILTP